MRTAVYLIILYFVALLLFTVPSLLSALDVDGLCIVAMLLALLLWGLYKVTK